jgi:hypothetical protein
MISRFIDSTQATNFPSPAASGIFGQSGPGRLRKAGGLKNAYAFSRICQYLVTSRHSELFADDPSPKACKPARPLLLISLGASALAKVQLIKRGQEQ